MGVNQRDSSKAFGTTPVKYLCLIQNQNCRDQWLIFITQDSLSGLKFSHSTGKFYRKRSLKELLTDITNAEEVTKLKQKALVALVSAQHNVKYPSNQIKHEFLIYDLQHKKGVWQQINIYFAHSYWISTWLLKPFKERESPLTARWVVPSNKTFWVIYIIALCISGLDLRHCPNHSTCNAWQFN